MRESIAAFRTNVNIMALIESLVSGRFSLSSSHRSMMITWSLDARNLSHIRDRGSSRRMVISEPLPLRKSWPTKFSISCFAPISRHASISKSSSLPSFSVDESDGGLITKKRMSGKPDFRKRALSSSSLWDRLKQN